MNDLKDEVKARFNEDEKLVLALLDVPEVMLDEVDDDYGCVGHYKYSFSTIDPDIAEKYGFMAEAEREARAKNARAAADKREAERAAEEAAIRARVEAEGVEAVLADVRARLVAKRGTAGEAAIWNAVTNVTKGDLMQALLMMKAVPA
jgi:hypothetical protein